MDIIIKHKEKRKMKKPHLMHESAYKKIRKNGGKIWGDKDGSNDSGIDIDPVQKIFIEEILSKKWSPDNGVALELGCGTGQIIRWFTNSSDFEGIGIDVSPTAIKMAKEQSKRTGLKFFNVDFLNQDILEKKSINIVIDGHCLHCVTLVEDRRKFMANAYSVLKPGGIFLVSTMCSPIFRGSMKKRFPKSKYMDRTHYHIFENGMEYEGYLNIDGKTYVPSRYFDHWKNILTDLKKAGFEIRAFKYSAAIHGEDLNSGLEVAAYKC